MRWICWDTETTVVDLDAGVVPDLVCSVFYEVGGAPEMLAADDTIDRMGELLADPDVIFVGHNLPFDFTVLQKAAPELWLPILAAHDTGRVRDTKVRQQLLDVRDGLASDHDAGDDEGGGRIVFRRAKDGSWYKSGLSLAALEFHYLGRDRSADKKNPASWRFRFGELRGVPVAEYPEDAQRYVLDDAVGTWEVFEAQERNAEEWQDVNRSIPDEIEQCQSALALRLIEIRGMKVDSERTAVLKERATREFAAIREKMSSAEAGFFRAEGVVDPITGNLPPTRQVGTRNKKAIEARVVAAYQALGQPVPRTKKGGVSCDKDCLKNSGDPLLVELSGAGPLGSTVNTFLPILEKGLANGGRIHTKYNNMLATGRISSSGPNLNNIPRDGGVRECIEAAPGYALVSSDYDCAELRSWAQVQYYLFKKSAMGDFFKANPRGDPHADLAAFELKISAEDALGRKQAEESEFMKVRQACKSLNFGLPGGMGSEKLRITAKRQYGVTMTPLEAKKRKYTWEKRWRVQQYMNHVSHISDVKDSIRQMAPPGHGPHRIRGRNPREPGRWYSQVANSYFQGLTADGAKRALWLVTLATFDPQSPLFGAHVVGFLYDELILEIPLNHVHEGAAELERLMVLGMSYWVPDVPVTAGPKAMARWSKKAKAVWVDGRLAVWGLTSALC